MKTLVPHHYLSLVNSYKYIQFFQKAFLHIKSFQTRLSIILRKSNFVLVFESSLFYGCSNEKQ